MINNLLLIAIKASIDAGKAIIDIYENHDFEVDFKADNSPLTIADKTGHNIIFDELSKLELPILSEEGIIPDYQTRKNWNRYWCIDPLDGTKEFIKRNGEFTVNIALIENNTLIAGVIYVPVTKELYFSSIDIGSFKINDISNIELLDLDILVKISEKLPIIKKRNAFTIVASRSHLNEETETFIKKMETRFGKVETISKGSSLKLCMVAEGLADIYPRYAPTMEWDTAAGSAIALYAGFETTKDDGITKLDYNKQNLLNPNFIVKPKNFKI
jgi:3'(2'), 5'-bisphosphate nucleotidase